MCYRLLRVLVVSKVEEGVDRSTVTNFDEVKGAIVEQLESLRDCPVRRERPLIYHLDVAAMLVYTFAYHHAKVQTNTRVPIRTCRKWLWLQGF